MGFISSLLGGAAAEPIKAVGNIVDSLFTSDDERLSHKEVMARIAQNPQIAAQEIAKVQASSRSTFVAGARPFVVWVCGMGLGYAWVIRPMIQDLATYMGKVIVWTPMQTDNMTDLVIAILGLGALRTVEKLQNKAK